MQTTILLLQQELRKSKQTIASLEKALNSQNSAKTGDLNNHSTPGVNGTEATTNGSSNGGDRTECSENNKESGERTFSGSESAGRFAGSESVGASAAHVGSKRTTGPGVGGDGALPCKRTRSDSVEFEMSYSDPEETLTALTNGK